MQTLILISFMVVIGAFIGGLTNSLAIKMLFRPYNVIKIGSWSLPFTPGLIPKRREELATQLGKMVVDYLLTAEGFSKKLKSATFTEEMITWLQSKVKEILHSEASIADLMEKHTRIRQPKNMLLGRTESFVTKEYKAYFDTHRTKSIDKLIPVPIQKGIETRIPNVTDYLLVRGQEFLQSPKGKERLSMMIERFLAQKGTIGNMVSMFLGQERLADKIHPELMKFLRDEGTNELVENLLFQEWENIKQKSLAEVEEYIKEEEVISYIVQAVDKQIPLYQWIEQPLSEWTSVYEEKIIDGFVPEGVAIMLDMLAAHVESLLGRLHLDDIIREQVQAFSIERLEELVLSIAKRELKLITYLGALLGGVIGLIQSLIVIVTS